MPRYFNSITTIRNFFTVKRIDGVLKRDTLHYSCVLYSIYRDDFELL